MMLVIGVLRFTPLSPTDLQNSLQNVLPEVLQPLLDYMIQELFTVESTAVLSITAIAALWSASKGVYSFHRGINKVYQVRETRSFLLVRLRCAFYTVLLLAALILTALLHVLEQHLRVFMAGRGTPLFRVLSAIFSMKYTIIVLLLTLLFSSIYVLFPNKKVRFSDSLPGAFTSAVLWVVFSQLFTYYVSRFGNYSLYYGSLSIIAVTMLWLYVCMLILFYGGVLNCMLTELRQASLARRAASAESEPQHKPSSQP